MAKKKRERPSPASAGNAPQDPASRNSSTSHKPPQRKPRNPARLRRQLDALDDQLLKLANERVIVDLQQRGKAPPSTPDAGPTPASPAANADTQSLLIDIHDDEARLERLVAANPGPLSDAAVRTLFRELFHAGLQHSGTARVGYLGPAHSYSHLAAIEYFGSQYELIPLSAISAVFEGVHSGNLEFGVVPLENSTDGRIADTFHMLARVQVAVAAEIPLAIHHCLLGRGPRAAVRRVCSKPQALSQCREWLAENLPQAELVSAASTTLAAEEAARDTATAAIASRQAALHYSLPILAENIEDHRQNVTRFAVLAPTSAPRSGRDKTLLLFQVRHQPGALADVMAVFKRHKINLTWIESFPLHDRPQEYFFLAELQGHAQDLRVRRTLASLVRKTEKLQVLGSFAAARRHL